MNKDLHLQARLVEKFQKRFAHLSYFSYFAPMRRMTYMEVVEVALQIEDWDGDLFIRGNRVSVGAFGDIELNWLTWEGWETAGFSDYWGIDIESFVKGIWPVGHGDSVASFYVVLSEVDADDTKDCYVRGVDGGMEFVLVD